jgi:hypothetical protein
MTTEAAQAPSFEELERAKDREIVREERRSLALIEAQDVTTSALRTTFLPQNMTEAMQLAKMMANSNFVPAHLRGKEGDCMAVLMISMRWGMDPFAVALKTYFMKDGAPPAFEAQLVNAVVNSSNALSGRLRVQWEGEGEKLRTTVSGYLRADPDDLKVRTQSIARVTVRNSPLWKTDPEQQHAYLLTRAWARLYCPEVLLGVYTPDEMDIDPERARNVTPMPRRGQLPDLPEEPFDPATGEVEKPAAHIDVPATEESERALDRERLAAMQRGEVDAVPDDVIDGFYNRLNAAKMIGDVLGVESDFARCRDGVDEDVALALDDEIAAGKVRYKRQAA